MDDFFDSDPDDPGFGDSEPATAETRTGRGSAVRKPRPAVNPAERKRLLIRRAIAVGIGIVVFILIVLGIRSCIDARGNRALEDYASNVTQLTDETNTLGKTTFETIEDPGSLSITDFTDEIETDRNQMDAFLTRVERLDVPGDMESAQRTLLTAYQLRTDAMGVIASKMPTALGDEGSEDAINAIANSVEVLNAADVIFNRVTRHRIDGEIAASGASAPKLPRAQFVPPGKDWTDPATIASALSGISGATPATDDGAIHGTGISTVAIGGVALDSSVDNIIPAGTDPTVEVSVTNQGEAEESDISVTASLGDGSSGEGTITTLAVGETGLATITFDSSPSGQTELTISVAAVPGETLLDNNEATYTVTFE
jgi:hypothetical protein